MSPDDPRAHEVSSYRVLHGDDEHVLIRQHGWQPTRQVASLLAQVVSCFIMKNEWWAFEHVSQDTPTHFQFRSCYPSCDCCIWCAYTSNQSQLAASAIPKTGYWAEGHSARGELGEALNLGVKMAEENLPWAFLPCAWLNRNPLPRFWSICVKGMLV